MTKQTIYSLLQRILESNITDARIPKEKIGEEKEYKWRASGQNHEPILINNETGEIVAGIGNNWVPPQRIEPKYYKVDIIPEGPHKGKSGYKRYLDDGTASYFPDSFFGKNPPKAEYEISHKTSPPEVAKQLKPTGQKEIVKITPDNRPPNTDTTEKKRMFWDVYAQKFNEAIENKKVSDEHLAFLYTTLSSRFYPSAFTMSNTKQSYVSTTPSGAVYEIKILDLNKFPHGLGTALHELGHYIDCTEKANEWFSGGGLATALNDENDNEIPEELFNEIMKAKQKREDKLQEVNDELNKAVAKIEQQIKEAPSLYKQMMLLEKRDKLMTKNEKTSKKADVGYWGQFGDGINAVTDICDAILRGKLFDDYGTYGHGKEYFMRKGAREREIWADYCHLAILHPEALALIEKHYPKTIQACREMSKELAKKWRKKQSA